MKVESLSEVFSTPVSSLHDGNVSTQSCAVISCDICATKGTTSIPALVYCTTCSKTFCIKHQQLHDELLEDHQNVSMEEYKIQARKYEARMCEQHEEHSYIAGCHLCLTLYCVKCLSGIANCVNGKPHQLISLDDLLVDISKTIEEIKLKMVDKEMKILSIIKGASTFISDHETATGEMVKQLHKARDEQEIEELGEDNFELQSVNSVYTNISHISALRNKYAELETQLIKQRKQTQTQVSAFAENKMTAALCKLSETRQKIESELKYNHQVDVVIHYGDTRSQLNSLIQEKLPILNVKSVKLDQSRGQKRNLELHIAPAEDISVQNLLVYPKSSVSPNDSNQGRLKCPRLTRYTLRCELATQQPKSPPSLKFILEANLKSGRCEVSLCPCRDYFCIGYGNSVFRFDRHCQLHPITKAFDGFICGIQEYSGVLYLLLRVGVSYVIHASSLKSKPSGKRSRKRGGGNHATSWVVIEAEQYSQPINFAITNNQVIVPNRRIRSLAIFSTGGKHRRYVSCPHLGEGSVVLSAVSVNSIAVNDSSSSMLCTMDICKGTVLWSYNYGEKDLLGLTCYGNRYLFSYSRKNNSIHVFNTQTGGSVVAASVGVTGCQGYHLAITNHTLAVACGIGKQGKVLLYKIEHNKTTN